MRSQLGALIRNEVAKAIRRKLPYLGIFAVGLLAFIIHLVADRMSTAASANGWGYVAFSMQLIFADIGPIFVIVFSAMSLAEETGGGTIRAVLVAPIHRWELYLAKAAVGFIYMLVLSVAALACSVILAKTQFGFGEVRDAFGVVYARHQALQQFLLAYALSWIPLGALVVYGLLISTLVRSPGAAVATGISTLFLIDFTKHLVGLDPYIFTRYIGYPWTIIQQLAQGMDYQWQPEAWRMLLLCGAYGIGTFGIGLLVFVKEDLNH